MKEKEKKKPVFIVWNENKHCTGLEDIDEQHKELVDIINEVFDARKLKCTKKAMEKILKKLIKYIKIHFKYEEKKLLAAKYKKLKVQQHKHAAFTSKVKTFINHYLNGKETLNDDILKYLKQWLTEHIMYEDMKYVEYIKKNQESL
jgi:hemerythrin-like metal-binding protein